MGKPEFSDNPWGEQKILKGKALKAVRENCETEDFQLYGLFSNEEGGMTQLIMEIARLRSLKVEFRVLKTPKNIEIWAKKPALEVAETRGNIASNLANPESER